MMITAGRPYTIMSNILLTGGRAPATLELARAFHRAGHTVFMAESLRGHLSEPSAALAKNFLVPPPRQQTSDFLDALEKIVRENKIDLVIPTCEEVFYVAIGRERFPAFVESLEKLRTLHNKLDFIELARGLGLPVPETALIETEADLRSAFERWPRLVLKPVYSRFASKTLIQPTIEQSQSAISFDARWVAQEFVAGEQVCTYSVCHHGRITAHTAYRSDFTAGQGATIFFRHVNHAATLTWVTKFVAETEFTGQIAFDFIETREGKIFAIECNPRAISGIHLLARDPHFPETFLNSSEPCAIPSEEFSTQLWTGMLFYGLPTALKKHRVKKWWTAFRSSRDVIFRGDDPLPALLQFRSIFHYLQLARRENISLLEASTFDIEWNG
jgi:predicted ATP-grasp superfamily ATP-dependent carboligase